jgi:hypothetical protein
MCCEAPGALDQPAEVIEMIARYRALQAERGWDWGDDRIDLFRWARFAALGPVLEAYGETGDWPAAVRAVLGADLPAGVVVVRIEEDRRLSARTGPARLGLAGRPVQLDVVLDSAALDEVTVTVAGRPTRVPAGGAAVATVDLDGGGPALRVALGDGALGDRPLGDRPLGGRALAVESAVRTVPAAELRLTSPRCARWSVTDAAGGAWFPAGVPAKWDVHDRPFFHARDVTLAVPAAALRVACARGLEYDRVEQEVTPAPGECRTVDCDPPRLVDPAATGWYGGDLHVHLNYSGDLVCTPPDAARMQLGEGLHLLNLVAGNCQTSLVYDRELLETTAGTDLPWSGPDAVARMGVEYRNDLLGHVHGLGPSAPPGRYHAGHERSDAPADWPPNRDACAELRALGATVGYAHPSYTPFPDGSTDDFFATPRSVEARELVADAALGVVDSVDLISPFDDEGAVFLYHRLLSCGLRLAATAGTDAFLSFAHGPGVASNPPGWGRVYAQLGDRPLSVAAFQDAIRAGRTVVTNGPWLILEVGGAGPGTVLDAAAGDRLRIRATVTGAGAGEVTVVGPDGPLATGPGTVELETTVDSALWIAAVARGPGHPNTLDRAVLAHTSPVYVDVAGRRVARARDARWCLDLLDRLEGFAAEHGHFDAAGQLRDLVAVLEEARAFYRGVVATAPPPPGPGGSPGAPRPAAGSGYSGSTGSPGASRRSDR